MNSLRLADGLDIPLQIVTEKLAFLGRTGSGKTYAATKLAELMVDAGAQVIALDPVGVWAGLRVGPHALTSVYVFGGRSGAYDVPLESTGGALVADMLVERGISAVLDVSQFGTQTEVVRFATDFASRFFARKKAHPTAVHLFLEECQEFVPQNAQPGEQRMLHEFERLWKLGRNFGIGGSLISQRPQEINKKALNQAGTLFVFQMTGPQERKAIEAWAADKAIDEDLGALLPKLQVGSPRVWSPTFLEVSKTVRILPKRTSDVSQTPQVGVDRAARALTPVDIDALQSAMAGTIERAKAEDPRELRKRIADLQRQLAAKAVTSTHIAETKPLKVVEKPVLKDGQLARAEQVLARIEKSAERFSEFEEDLRVTAKEIREAIAKTSQPQPLRPASPPQQRPFNTSSAIARAADRITGRAAAAEVQKRTAPERTAGAPSGAIGKGERVILTAVAQYPEGASREQLTVLTGYKRSSRDTYLQRLQSAGLVDASGGNLLTTDAGIAALGTDFEPLPTGSALLAYWLDRLGGGERVILAALTSTGRPAWVDRDALSENTGYKRSSRDTYLQRLQSRRLVVAERGAVRASDQLFD